MSQSRRTVTRDTFLFLREDTAPSGLMLCLRYTYGPVFFFFSVFGCLLAGIAGRHKRRSEMCLSVAAAKFGYIVAALVVPLL